MYPIIFLVVILALILVGLIFWTQNNAAGPPVVNYSSELKTVREIFRVDVHLQRLLLIEIIHADRSASAAITFNKIESGITLLGKTLVRFLGGATAQTLAELLRNRAQIIQEYYQALQQVVCTEGTCQYVQPADPFPIIRPIEISSDKNNPNNLTSEIQNRLDEVKNQIMEAMAHSAHLINLPIKLDRLNNFWTMYDQEIINQARAYASHQYEISMNCNQSTLELAAHLGNEFNFLMQAAQPSISA